MPRDPYNPFDDKSVGLAMLGTVFFSSVTGLGIGAFVAEPAVGGLCGGAVGITAGLYLVPALMRDWRD